MAKSARRHYRAAQKEAFFGSSKGLFIPRSRQPKLIMAAVFIGLVAFIDGLVIGALIAKK